MYGGIIIQGIREALAKSYQGADELRKAIQVSTGFNIQNWELGYKALIPITPTWFRDRVFSRPDAEGNGLAWKILKTMDANKALAYVPEGKRAAEIKIESRDGSCGWKTWGVEDGFTQEAEQQNASFLGAPGTEDLCIANLAQAFAQKDERIIWAANNDVALATAPTPAGSAADPGADETSAVTQAGKWYAKVVAMTHDGGMLASAVDGLVPVKAVISAAGESYNINGGLSLPSGASAAVVVAAGDVVRFAVSKRNPDVYYGWFVAVTAADADPPTNADYYLQAVTSSTEVVFYADPVTEGRQSLAALVAAGLTEDRSCVNIAPNGIFSQLCKTSEWVHFRHLSKSESNLSLEKGHVPVIKEAMREMWNRLRIGPETFLVSANTYNALNDLAVGDGNLKSAFVFETIQTVAGIQLSARLRGIINPYTGETVPIDVYPNIADGWIVGVRMTAFIPGQPSTRTVEIQSFGGVWRVDWTPITRTNYHGMYRAGGIKMYLPSAYIVITGVNTDTYGQDVSDVPGLGYAM